ncbi:diphthamide biosynthesis protein 3 [Enteropsectra breve]|nr:diphthamide biosynthesis protein 3 [Enteropsectra breve]
MDYESYFARNKTEEDFLSYYDEIDILDFKFHPETQQFSYPCPCGDIFIISLDDMKNGETVARCVSCSLIVFVVYEQKDVERYESSLGAEAQ